MNMQAAVEVPRYHHPWLPDRIDYARNGLSPDTLNILSTRGHPLKIAW